MKSILTKAKKLSNTAILFLLLAPAIVVFYGSYVFNPANMSNPLLYLMLVIADAISMVSVMGLWFTILFDVLVPTHHEEIPMSKKTSFLRSKPKVDILITTAGEPIEIVRKTLEAALLVSYPHKTFVLDDAKSSEMKSLVEKTKAFYVIREDNSFAKSGNVNNALKRASEGEFFIILDADQIAKPNMIITLLPYMSDSSIAMVQSPQSFTNLNKFISFGTSQAQEVFYKYVCPAKNISNSAFSVGTNVMFRRSAIDGIGGIAEISHSEDIWTTLRLHEKGWKTLFIHEVLAQGLAPSTIQSYFKQQHRWAKGGFSMLFDSSPIFSSNLTLDQKIQYFLSNTFYLVGITNLIYLLFPIIYLLFGSTPLSTGSFANWFVHYLPYVVLYYGLNWLFLGKLHIATISVSISSFYPYITAFFSSLMKGKDTWVATSSKKRKRDPYMKWLWPHFLIIILTLLSLVIGWYNPGNYWATLFYSILAIWNVYLLYVFITGEKRDVALN